MTVQRFLSLAILMIISSCAVQQAVRTDGLTTDTVKQIPTELRGAWITRFDWTDTDPDSMKIKISRIMQDLENANFNTVFFQVRGQCETLYPSPLEPWSKLVKFKDPGFDPVELAVEQAHKHNLKFYAYINLLPLWDETAHPRDQNHLFFKHGPQVNTRDSWVCFAEDGKPMELNSYYYLNPALPQVKTYLKEVVRQFVKNYNIDGLHFDRIRYPGSIYNNDPYSNKIFKEDSLDSPLTKAEWSRRQLTDLVEDLIVEAMLIKPYLVNSAAVWGMYRTDDISGYQQFKSGYAEYYQDAVDWLDKGIMDFIVPMMYWKMADSLPNFDDLWLDFKKRTPNYEYIFPGLRIYSCDWLESGETASQINFVRQKGGRGTVMFSLPPDKNSSWDIIRNTIYPQKANLPNHLKRTKAEQAAGFDLTEILLGEKSGQKISLLKGNRLKRTDSEGRIGLFIPKKLKKLDLKTDQSSFIFKTDEWKTPYNYVLQPDSSIARTQPWVEFRKMPSDTTSRADYHFLSRTGYPAKAWINTDSAKVYKTGVFFNKVTFKEGANRIRAAVQTQDSAEVFYEREFFYKKADLSRDDFPLWIDEKSVQPNADLKLLPEDMVRISFKGSKSQNAAVKIGPGLSIRCLRKDYNDFSLYQAEVPAKRLVNGKKYSINLLLNSVEKNTNEEIKFQLKNTIQVKEFYEFPLVKTTDKYSILNYSLGRPRLGPPIRAEYKPGVVLKTSGKFGKYYRVRLSSQEEGYIHERDIEELPVETIQPSYFINSMFCAPDSAADILRIPYYEPVPYAVYPEPDQKRIIISLYGVKTSSTWITHRKNRRYIEKVAWKQSTPETYQVIVNLKTAKIWGYDIKRAGKSLVFRVKYPPELNAVDSTKILDGIKIAIEAGHGGNNWGAVGLSGIKEKEINLDLSQKLAGICREHGAEILQVRDRDKGIWLTVKRDTARYSDSHMLISIHANASGSAERRGYLGANGASTYYNNPFWADLAEKIQNRLLELPIEEFGVVGSFNYLVIRVPEMPAILVEQAFMDHADDEEKLADEHFRSEMAQKIFEGIVDFIKLWNKSD